MYCGPILSFSFGVFGKSQARAVPVPGQECRVESLAVVLHTRSNARVLGVRITQAGVGREAAAEQSFGLDFRAPDAGVSAFTSVGDVPIWELS